MSMFATVRNRSQPSAHGRNRLRECDKLSTVASASGVVSKACGFGGLGVRLCSRKVVSMFATVRNRSQPSAHGRNRLRECDKLSTVASASGVVLKACGVEPWSSQLFTPLRVGGRPHRKFFGSVLVKILNMLQTFFLQCFLIVFLQHPRNLYIFGHNVGPKHRFLQCCFNLFFKNSIIYEFFNIKLVQNIVFCSVFNTLTSQIL